MGPFCEISNTVNDSNTGKETISCFWSHLQDHGYVLGSRYRILNYLSQVDYINPSFGVNDLEGMKALEQKYIPPMDDTKADYTPEYNVKIVAQCQNKYCNLCDDWNLTQCRTCWGRFGDKDSYGRCYDSKSCSSLTGCFKGSLSCDGCDICDTGYVLQDDTKKCTACSSIDSNCLECSGQSADSTLKCDICADGYGIDSTEKCKKCVGDNVKQCSFDSSGK